MSTNESTPSTKEGTNKRVLPTQGAPENPHTQLTPVEMEPTPSAEMEVTIQTTTGSNGTGNPHPNSPSYQESHFFYFQQTCSTQPNG